MAKSGARLFCVVLCMLHSSCGATSAVETVTPIAPPEGVPPTPLEVVTAASFSDGVVHIFAAGQIFQERRVALGVPAIAPGPDPELPIERDLIVEFLADLREAVEIEAVNGEVNLDTREVRPSQNGIAIPIAEAALAIETALRNGDPEIVIPVTDVLPPNGVVVPESLSLETVIAEYATEFSRRDQSRANNVDVAASRIDGAIIPPGGTLSYNDLVGPRTRVNGFAVARVIQNGEYVPGMGGGVCQPASTLHAAAYLGGLDVVEHHNHSRPSSYVPLGLDATVTWPYLDLVLRNPFDFAVYVRSWTDADGRHHVQLLGRESRRTVEFESEVGRALRFPTAAERRRGVEIPITWGIPGRMVARTRRLREGERAWEERDLVNYRFAPTALRAERRIIRLDGV